MERIIFAIRQKFQEGMTLKIVLYLSFRGIVALKVNERGYIYKLNETVRILFLNLCILLFIIYFTGEQYKFLLLDGKVLSTHFTIVQLRSNKSFSSEVKWNIQRKNWKNKCATEVYKMIFISMYELFSTLLYIIYDSPRLWNFSVSSVCQVWSWSFRRESSAILCYSIYKMVEALRCKTYIVVFVHMFIDEDTPACSYIRTTFPRSCLRKDLSTSLEEKLCGSKYRIMLPNEDDATGDVDPRAEVCKVGRMFPFLYKEMFVSSWKFAATAKKGRQTKVSDDYH